jgi:hypothetical protein
VLPEGGVSGLAGMELQGLPAPLREALVEASVVWLVPIASPREPWGYLFVTTSLLRATLSEGDAEALDGFGAQLALVLDGADLLARAVSVERSHTTSATPLLPPVVLPSSSCGSQARRLARNTESS